MTAQKKKRQPTTKPLRFLNVPDRIRGNLEKYRLHQCPYPRKCYPTDISTDYFGVGYCCGVMPEAQDLDCLALCAFPHNGKRNKHKDIEAMRAVMTPDEAVEIIRLLSWGVTACLDSNKGYQKHKRHLICNG